MILDNVYRDKTVLITGHTGFKGSWLSIWLISMGANVVGVSVDIPSKPSNFKSSKLSKLMDDYFIDIRDFQSLKKLINKIRPDFIFHLAAKSLVRTSYDFPLETISTNAMGTANILEAARDIEKSIILVMITSDKAYDNVEWKWGYRETDRLGGKDPYSASKGMAELVIRSYVESFLKNSKSNVSAGIARAGNVIGGGDWAQNRIVPDCMNAWSKGEIVEIRNPNATRPWQHVLEPLSGYLLLGVNLFQNKKFNGEAYNFGPSANQNYAVSDLIEQMACSWEKVRWKDISIDNNNFYEAGLLKLNCDKAMIDLKWEPTLKFEETVKMTVEWYKTFYDSENLSMFDYSLSQIKNFTSLARHQKMIWTL
tara:strand:+ start:364 stop:1464 length:1101 start_codon:yes stop_codon:yes gene_type:complete